MIEGRNFRLKRIPAALRGSGGGDIDPVQAALNRFSFHAPLTKSVLLSRGVGAASYTGATVKTVKDFEGGIRNTLSGEVRFEGQRRVCNIVPTTSEDFSNAAWAKGQSGAGILAVVTADYAVAPDGTTTADRAQLSLGGANTTSDMSFVAGTYTGYTSGRTYVFSVWMKSNTGSSANLSLYNFNTQSSLYTITTSWQRFYWTVTPGSTASSTFGIRLRGGQGMTDPADISIWHPQLEEVTGQSNQNPSEYVSVGAAKQNLLLQTEAINASPWADTATPIVAQNGMLGNAVAWQITDDNAAAHEARQQAVTVPNDSATYYFGLRIAKTSGGTAPVFALNFGFSGGATPISKNVRLNTDTGTTPYSNSFDVVIDRGTYWECIGSAANNTTGNTTLSFYIYPVAAAAGAGSDNPAATGSATVAAPWVATSIQSYFPVGNVYPYHGAMVDGVKYFDYENGNTVSSNVVTEAVGRSLDGYSVALLDGTTGYFSTPDSTALRITGKISLRAQVRAEDFTPSATQALIAKSGNRYMLRINTTGGLIFTWYDGSVQTSHSSTLPFPASDKTMLWARTDFEPDNGAGGRTTRFYWSADYNPDSLSGTWTLFDTITDAGVTQIGGHDTGALTVGYSASGPILAGAIRRAQVFNNDTGTKVADFNPREGWTENHFAYSEDFTQGVAWTQFTSGDGAVTRTSTAVCSAGPLGRAFVTSAALTNFAVGDVLRVAVTLSGINRDIAGSSLFNIAGGSGAFTSTIATTYTSGDNRRIEFDATCTAAGTFMLRMGLGCNANETGANVTVTFDNPQVRRLSVASQRTTSQYLPTTTAALRGWISSTGEQWTINGAATVLQRQAEGYLPEGASTNLVLQSSNFASATWVSVGTPTLSSAAKYCGDIALDLLGDDDAGVAEAKYQPITFTADADKSFSFVVSQGSSTSSAFALYDNTAPAYRASGALTWSNGVPVLAFSTGSEERPPEALGNGCYRCFIKGVGVIAANVNRVYVWPAATVGGGTPANTGTIYVGGVQAENATTASVSHIPTTTATVTRNADVLTWPGAGNVSQTAGSLYGEIYVIESGIFRPVLHTSDGTMNERVEINSGAAGPARLTIADGGVVQADVLNAGTFATGANKVAGRYASNDFQAAGNGSLGTADTSGTLPTTTTIYAGARPDGSYASRPIKNLRIATVTLSNQELTLITR